MEEKKFEGVEDDAEEFDFKVITELEYHRVAERVPMKDGKPDLIYAKP